MAAANSSSSTLFTPGDRAAVETLTGSIKAGEVVDVSLRTIDCRPVQYVSVRVSDSLTLTVPAAEAAAP